MLGAATPTAQDFVVENGSDCVAPASPAALPLVCDTSPFDEEQTWPILESRGRKFPIERVWHMSERHAEWETRAEECKRNAMVALDEARTAVSDQIKSEYLQIAAEWTRLAAAIVEAFLL
jgi:hypothetical protein